MNDARIVPGGLPSSSGGPPAIVPRDTMTQRSPTAGLVVATLVHRTIGARGAHPRCRSRDAGAFAGTADEQAAAASPSDKEVSQMPQSHAGLGVADIGPNPGGTDGIGLALASRRAARQGLPAPTPITIHQTRGRS
jgi:hypothetical protein